ncbi:hypothetical protein BH20ACI2_BH20ACI2_14590 [soil metagenome]
MLCIKCLTGVDERVKIEFSRGAVYSMNCVAFLSRESLPVDKLVIRINANISCN